MIRLRTLLLSTATALLSSISPAADVITPETIIDLLTTEGRTANLNEASSLSQDPSEIWKLNEDGHLDVSGEGMGYVRTDQAYRDYHLVVEYKWGERTLATRADRARDCGFLIHAYGKDGAYGKTWMSCIEAQLIEGGSGDILVLGSKQEDGSIDPTSVTATVTRDRDGEPVWDPEGKAEVFPAEGKTMARINWQHRDPDWADVKGYRGAKDIENPLGEWNRMEVICRADKMTIYLNGQLINEVTNCHPSEGYIGLQSEYAECLIRRLELHPLDSFSEKWAEEKRSSDMGYSITGESILPRRLPLSPEESQAAWEIDGDYEVQLVAAEPLTCDPVDVVWDEKGRMFVAEMGDYPLPLEEGPPLSRIRLLTDADGDGVMDKATTWAGELDHVQGLLPMKGGLLATTRTAILFLKDTDGDDVADVREVLFRSNEPRHNQLQVSSPRYHLNNDIYLSNGLDGKEIYPADQPDQILNFTRLNLRYNPRTGDLQPIPGAGQYGGTLDAFGRHFFCSNRNPAMFAVMPLEAVKRNPLAGITQGHEDIQAPGAPVRPISLSHTTSAAHAGTHTAACGIGVYTGDANPELTGDLFVCDPTAQLVTRNKLVQNGASFTAERVGEDREFLASADEWSRPVQVRNGPDGALYVVDMYRRFIDHARFFPEEFSKAHFMRAGFDQGRIWRIVPKGAKARKIEPLPEDSASLAKLLSHPNDWHRGHAQRLLVERQDKSALPVIADLLEEAPSGEAMVRALWTLAGLGELKKEQLELALDAGLIPSVSENALFAAIESEFASEIDSRILQMIGPDSPRVQFLALCLFPDVDIPSQHLAETIFRDPSDPWLRKAILSSRGEQAPGILAQLLSQEKFQRFDPFTSRDRDEAVGALTDFARHTAALGKLDQLAPALAQLKGEPKWWHFAIVSGISEGLRRSPLKQKSLAALIAANPPELGDGIATLKGLLDDATRIALDTKRSDEDREAALELVGQRPLADKLEIVEKLIVLTETPAVQAAAVRMLSRDKRDTVADFFFDRWDSLAPTPRREALTLITGNTNTGLALMKKMKAGEISPAAMPPMTRWSYGRSSNEEIKSLAKELFGQTDTDRASLISDYQAVLSKTEGDPEKGKLVFQKGACITCHEVGGVGVDVGPSLNDVKMKPPEALLTDILDPNRAVEERWVSQALSKKDGSSLSGLLHGEDAAAITLRVPGGVSMTVPRSEVESVQSTGMSLMPVGLEAAITKEEMVDLIAFLKLR
ncbi:MAG: DUF1080 domain-containing protein [Verrucomicrobiales bacterium]|nr:DUF1080 domain-containing protein [Verrucomicrobiales bacterium]